MVNILLYTKLYTGMSLIPCISSHAIKNTEILYSKYVEQKKKEDI